jgi:hypothetical protein
MVDVSPFSTNGALVLANAKDVDRDRFFKQLMVYGAIVVAVARRHSSPGSCSSFLAGGKSCFPN